MLVKADARDGGITVSKKTPLFGPRQSPAARAETTAVACTLFLGIAEPLWWRHRADFPILQVVSLSQFFPTIGIAVSTRRNGNLITHAEGKLRVTGRGQAQ